MVDNWVLVKSENSHRVYSSRTVRCDFLISRYPVTTSEFRDVTEDRPGDAVDRTTAKRVTWGEAIHYCNRLNRRNGFPPSYDEATAQLVDEHGVAVEDILEVDGFRLDARKVKGFRLPTLAEWEWAAMGLQQRDTGSYLDILDKTHYIWGMSNGKPPDPTCTALDTLSVNTIGLYGMLANAVEWCGDDSNGGTSRNRKCYWHEYFANYDNAISFDVQSDICDDATLNRFRVVLVRG